MVTQLDLEFHCHIVLNRVYLQKKLDLGYWSQNLVPYIASALNQLMLIREQ